jgi:hypothetical protein
MDQSGFQSEKVTEPLSVSFLRTIFLTILLRFCDEQKTTFFPDKGFIQTWHALSFACKAHFFLSKIISSLRV